MKEARKTGVRRGVAFGTTAQYYRIDSLSAWLSEKFVLSPVAPHHLEDFFPLPSIVANMQPRAIARQRGRVIRATASALAKNYSK